MLELYIRRLKQYNIYHINYYRQITLCLSLFHKTLDFSREHSNYFQTIFECQSFPKSPFEMSDCDAELVMPGALSFWRQFRRQQQQQ